MSGLSVDMIWEVQIPLRDGVLLAASLYLPRTPERVPGLATFTCYTRSSNHDVAMAFAARGYAFLSVDVRGRGGSQGSFGEPGIEGADAHEVIAWFADQAFCTGKIGLWGGSYQGYVQWLAAATQPAALRSIAPVSSPYRGIDGPIRKNIFNQFRLQWLNLIDGHTAQDRIFADAPFWRDRFLDHYLSGSAFPELATYLGAPPHLFDEWVRHPTQDAYWDAHNPTERALGGIDIPVLTITGAYDANQPGALAHYRRHLEARSNLDSEHYLIIGPWDHSGTRNPKSVFGGLHFHKVSVLDMVELHDQWFDWTLNAGPKPSFLSNRVVYYVAGAEEWRSVGSLNQVATNPKTYLFWSDADPIDPFRAGTLSVEERRGSEFAAFQHDPGARLLGEIERSLDPEDKTDQTLVHARTGEQLIYHSEPLRDDLDICGFFELDAWISIDRPDADVVVDIYAITPNGTSILLSSDVVRMRYRDSLRTAKTVDTSVPVLVRFKDFPFVGRQMKAGSRLRVALHCLDSIYWQKNFGAEKPVLEQTAEDSRPVRVQLFHSKPHQSVLRVPEVAPPDPASTHHNQGSKHVKYGD